MGKRARLVAGENEVEEEEEAEEVVEESSIREDFEQLHIDARLVNVLQDEFEIAHLFPLQKRALQRMVDSPEQDVCINAPTGSGKTLMYSIPLVNALASRIVPRVRGLVLCPSRDLAKQVHAVVDALGQAVGLRSVLLAGECSLAQETKQLLTATSTATDVVVATPGRLLDHLANTPGFSLEHLEYLVCDEADRLLNQSYQDWLDRVYEHAYQPASSSNPRTFSHTRSVLSAETSTRVRKILCSATLTRNPEKLHKLAMFRPLLVQPGKEGGGADGNSDDDDDEVGQLPPTLQELAYRVTLEDKPLVLLQLLKGFITSTSAERAVVFCSSVARAERLQALCESAFGGQKCRVMSAALATRERAQLLLDFKQRRFPVLIGSDLAARGLDIPQLEAVISYDVPQHASTYVHRSGRTARAGQLGKSIVLLQNSQARHFREIKAKVSNSKSNSKLQFADLANAQLFDDWLPVLAKWKKTAGSSSN